MSKINELILELCPNGVEYKNIKDLCLENFWVMPSTPNYQNEGIPYITSKNIRNGIVMFDDVKYITEEDYKSISNNICYSYLRIDFIHNINSFNLINIYLYLLKGYFCPMRI